MNFNEYQKETRATAIYPDKYEVVYPALGLAGEAGEVAELVKKVLRDHKASFQDAEFLAKVNKELGDVLWYIARIADDLQLDLGAIAAANLMKLRERKDNGTLLRREGRSD